MKKAFICLTLGTLVFATGCGEKLSSYDKTMKDYATNYYNILLKGSEGLTTYKLTVATLRDAVKQNVVNYDMGKLEKCSDDSYVELTINTSDNEIEKIEYHMTCSK